MSRRLGGAAALALAMLAVPAGPAFAASAPRVVFPTDRLTVRDARQATGRRVKLPLTGCATHPSQCDAERLANRLDGFDVDPRIAIRFDRRINLRKAQAGVTLRIAKGGTRVRVDRLVWDSATRTLYLHPAKQLQAARTYRIDVSPRIAGRFAIARFTTMSTTITLRRMAAAIASGTAYSQAGIAPGDRGLTVDKAFQAAAVTGLRAVVQTTTGGATTAADVPNLATTNAGLYAFGSLRAPSWLGTQRVMQPTPTRRTPRPTGTERIGFALIVPSGAPPAGGWPVAIFGHGFGGSKYNVFLAADRNAALGVATIAIDAVGHGGGPNSTLEVSTTGGVVTPVPSYGRSQDTDGDGNISFFESLNAPPAPDTNSAVQLRDSLRQTALDVSSLVQALRRGVDVDGNGSVDLSRSRIGYYGQSLGGIYGTIAVGADPYLEYGLLNVPGGPITDISRLSPNFRPIVVQTLGASRPSLLNGPGQGFTEDQPLPGDPPVSKPAKGAIAIQDALALTSWIDRSGSPEGFSPLLRGRRVLVQVAYGDQTVPNPTAGFVVRAGGLLGRTTMYRNDKTSSAGSNPHAFLTDPRLAGRTGGQEQAAAFLASDGTQVVDPDGSGGVFEVPVSSPDELLRLHFDSPGAVVRSRPR
jgi:dienelactone hydrolase